MRCCRSRVVSVAAALFGTTLLAACGDSTAPKPFTIAITVDEALPAQFTTNESGEQVIVCEIGLSAQATGPGTAMWEDAVARFSYGKDRATPVDSFLVARREAREWWGGESIAEGAPQRTGLWFSASIPFTISIDFRYRANEGAVKTATVAFDCGPRVTPTSAAPTISNLTAEAPGGELEPGDTLLVRYAASSPIGLWHTEVFMSGPCEISREFDQKLPAAVSQAVAIVLPADCELGAQVNVAVFATDAAGQTTARHVATSYSTVDRTPPTLNVVTNSRFGTGPTAFLAGTYFTGDTIDLQVRSRDNHRVERIVWEAFQGRIKDSTTVGLAVADTRVRIPIPTEWLGSVDLRFVIRDASGLTSAAASPAPNAIQVLPTTPHPAVRVAASPGIADVVFDSRRGTAYLLSWNAQQVSVLSLAAGRVTGSIPLDGPSSTFDLTAGGDSLVVVLVGENALGIIDLGQPQPSLRKVPLLGLDPRAAQSYFALRSAANGKVLLSAALMGPTSNSMRVLELDLATGAQRARTDADPDPWRLPFRMERTPDHSVVALLGNGCVGRYEAASDRILPCQNVASNYEYLSIDAAGQYVLAGLDLYDASGQLVRTLERPFHWNTPKATALSPNGADAYYAIGTAGIAHVRVSDGRLLERIPSPTIGGRVFVSPDGRWLIAVPGESTSSPDVAVIDLSTAAGSTGRTGRSR